MLSGAILDSDQDFLCKAHQYMVWSLMVLWMVSQHNLIRHAIQSEWVKPNQIQNVFKFSVQY